eukprot:SM000378S14269  [mRNA]  locus=s378:9268:15474:+ [translate_table: standard]
MRAGGRLHEPQAGGAAAGGARVGARARGPDAADAPGVAAWARSLSPGVFDPLSLKLGKAAALAAPWGPLPAVDDGPAKLRKPRGKTADGREAASAEQPSDALQPALSLPAKTDVVPTSGFRSLSLRNGITMANDYEVVTSTIVNGASPAAAEPIGELAALVLRTALEPAAGARWLPARSREADLAFLVLRRFLETDGGGGGGGMARAAAEAALVDLVAHRPALAPRAAALADALGSPLRGPLLATMQASLLPQLPPSSAVLPLAAALAGEPALSPAPLAAILLKYCRRKTTTAAMNPRRSWFHGSQVLDICWTLMLTHQSSRLAGPLGTLLNYLSSSYPDLDIQDTARLYLQLLTRVPGNRVRSLLADRKPDSSSSAQLRAEASSGYENGAKEGLLMSVASDAPPAAGHMCIKRAQPPLVAHSWRLCLQKDLPSEPTTTTTTSVCNDLNSGEAAQPDKVAIPDSDANLLAVYLANLQEASRKEAPIVVVDCRLQLTDPVLRRREAVENVDVVTSLPDDKSGSGSATSAVYAVKLSFSTSARYGPIPSQHVAVLRASLASEEGLVEEGGQPVDGRPLLQAGEEGRGLGEAARKRERRWWGSQRRQLEQATEAGDAGVSGSELGQDGGEGAEEGGGERDGRDAAAARGDLRGGRRKEAGKDSGHCLRLELRPCEPLPALVDVAAIFTDDSGQTVEGPLEGIPISLEDLFLPASMPSQLADAHPYPLAKLYSTLWAACAGGPVECGSTVGEKEHIVVDGSGATKLLDVPVSSIISAVEAHLAAFVVAVSGSRLVEAMLGTPGMDGVEWRKVAATMDPSPSSEAGGLCEDDSGDVSPLASPSLPEDGDRLHLEWPSEAETPLWLTDQSAGPVKSAAEACPPGIGRFGGEMLGTVEVLIHLPPRYHLLVRLEVGSVSTTARLRTDFWPCLAHVDELLETIL